MSFEQTIYNRLRYHGLTEAGALGCVGNFLCESNCEPYRLQGDFSPYRTASHIYVQGVTNGSISRDQFSFDQKGFGIYQLTYHTRKRGYYNAWKESGKALDDAELQVDYAIKEMESDYPQLLAFLKATTDIFTACSRVCREFERPVVNNIDSRFAAAKRIQGEIDLDGGGDVDPTPVVDHSLHLRTIDRNCSGWDETFLAQDLLRLRNYDVSVDGQWNNDLVAVVKEFQKDNNLEVDGMIGNNTWNALLKR